MIFRITSLFLILSPFTHDVASTCYWLFSSCNFLKCNELTTDGVEQSLCEMRPMILDRNANGCLALDIHYSNINRIKITTLSLRRFWNYEEIKLTRSKVQFIDEDAFIKFRNLKRLILRENKLQVIKLATGLKHLRLLDLSHNKLRSVQSRHLPRLFNLTVLKLDSNRLTSFEMLLCNFQELEELYAANNSLTSIEGYFKCNFNLKIVDLSKNKIAKISLDVFHNLTQLTRLLLDENQLRFQDSNIFKNLHKLERLTLSYNKIHVLNSTNTSAIEGLPNIKMTKIENVDTLSFFGFTELQYLNLTNNSLEAILDDTFNLTRLKELDVSFNYISVLSLGSFSNLNELRYLNLRFNRITKLEPKLFNELPLLETLDLSRNQICDLPNNIFSDLHSLNSLNISYNQITELNVAQESLTRLFINNNNILNLNISLFIKEFPRLSSIDLNKNKIICSNLKYVLKYFNTSNISYVRTGNYLTETIDGVDCELEQQLNEILWTKMPQISRGCHVKINVLALLLIVVCILICGDNKVKIF